MIACETSGHRVTEDTVLQTIFLRSGKSWKLRKHFFCKFEKDNHEAMTRMRILVIPDIHLKTWIFDRAEDILKASKADQAVCLMDIPDDWDMEFQTEMYKETFQGHIRIHCGVTAIMM